MPVTTHNPDLTLIIGEPKTFDLQTLLPAAGLTYQQGDLLLYSVVRAATDETLYNAVDVSFLGDQLVLTALDWAEVQRTAIVGHLQDIHIDLWYTSAPTDIYRFRVVRVLPERRQQEEEKRLVSMRLWGVGDTYDMPFLGYFDAGTPHPTPTLQTGGDAVLSVTHTDKTKPAILTAKAEGTAFVDYGEKPVTGDTLYSFQVNVKAPNLADDTTHAETLYIHPAGRITLRPSTLLDAIPDAYKDALALGGLSFEVTQGSSICSVETGADNTYPRLQIGVYNTATESRNYTCSVAIKDTATSTTRYTLRFYVSVAKLNGRFPQNTFPVFAGVPQSNPILPEDDTMAGNPAPPESGLHQNPLYPPPVRDSLLEEEKKYRGTLPDRPPANEIGVIIGQIEQQGTGTQIGLVDPRRLETVTPEILEGGIWDATKDLPEDFYIEWPHAE